MREREIFPDAIRSVSHTLSIAAHSLSELLGEDIIQPSSPFSRYLPSLTLNLISLLLLFHTVQVFLLRYDQSVKMESLVEKSSFFISTDSKKIQMIPATSATEEELNQFSGVTQVVNRFPEVEVIIHYIWSSSREINSFFVSIS